MALETALLSGAPGSLLLNAPAHYQTQSYDPISCYGNSVERTNEIVYRIFYEFLLSRTTESDSGAGR